MGKGPPRARALGKNPCRDKQLCHVWGVANKSAARMRRGFPRPKRARCAVHWCAIG